MGIIVNAILAAEHLQETSHWALPCTQGDKSFGALSGQPISLELSQPQLVWTF